MYRRFTAPGVRFTVRGVSNCESNSVNPTIVNPPIVNLILTPNPDAEPQRLETGAFNPVRIKILKVDHLWAS
jgi:hypothetical protein